MPSPDATTTPVPCDNLNCATCILLWTVCSYNPHIEVILLISVLRFLPHATRNMENCTVAIVDSELQTLYDYFEREKLL
jgi:hypothetical protein